MTFCVPERRPASCPPPSWNAESGVRAFTYSAPMPLRATHLVRGERCGIDIPFAHVKRHLPQSLSRVDVEERAVGVRDGGKLAHRLDAAELGVRSLNGHEHRVRIDRFLKRVCGDEAARVGAQGASRESPAARAALQA